MTREEVEAMSHEERSARLDELSRELFSMANAFALDKVSGVGTYLHESVNNIWAAQKIIKGEASAEIPARFIARSMGYKEPMVDISKMGN